MPNSKRLIGEIFDRLQKMSREICAEILRYLVNTFIRYNSNFKNFRFYGV